MEPEVAMSVCMEEVSEYCSCSPEALVTHLRLAAHSGLCVNSCLLRNTQLQVASLLASRHSLRDSYQKFSYFHKQLKIKHSKI